MEVKRICALYFSPTGNTRRAVCAAANALAEHYQLPCEEISVTLPHERVERDFGAGDLVVVGGPTYAGKLPNKMLPYFQSGLHGNGALAAAVVTYGNRSFDNSLAELCASLEMDGFHTAAGGAFVGTHAFSDALGRDGPGRTTCMRSSGLQQRSRKRSTGRKAFPLRSLWTATRLPPITCLRELMVRPQSF